MDEDDAIGASVSDEPTLKSGAATGEQRRDRDRHLSINMPGTSLSAKLTLWH